MKQVLIQFNFPNVSLQQYDRVWDDMRATGNAHPKGLISHVGAPTPDAGYVLLTSGNHRMLSMNLETR